MAALWFFIGLWIGGIVGVVTMCIFQVLKSKQSAKGDLI